MVFLNFTEIPWAEASVNTKAHPPLEAARASVGTEGKVPGLARALRSGSQRGGGQQLRGWTEVILIAGPNSSLCQDKGRGFHGLIKQHLLLPVGRETQRLLLALSTVPA